MKKCKKKKRGFIIFLILFFVIFIALYSTKTNKKYYWRSAFITEIIPLISLIICSAHIGDTPLAEYIFPVSLVSFIFCTPVGGLLYSFPDDYISSMIATVIGFVSPIVSMVIYRIKNKG